MAELKTKVTIWERGYGGTGLLYSASYGRNERTSWLRVARRSRSRGRGPVARAVGALDPGRHPGGTTGGRSATAVDPRSGDGAGSLARSGQRGLRTARSRGLPPLPPGRARAGGPHGSRAG